MRITKLTHACVRIESASTTIVLDPGPFGGFPDLDGVDAVLVTHAHFDHVDPDALRAVMQQRDLPVWTNAAVAQLLDAPSGVTQVTDGDSFTIGDIEVSVRGTEHARMHPDNPPDPNIGFFIGGRVFHPGDALTVLEEDIDLLLPPVNAPWLRAIDLIEYIRAQKPGQMVAIHDGLLNDNGLLVADRVLGMASQDAGIPGRRLEPGTTIDLDEAAA